MFRPRGLKAAPMMMAVRQQMICIIAPGWGGGAELPDQVKTSLTNLLCDVGVVHFASIALLPALGEALDRSPSLMLELVTEEGLAPGELLHRLVNHPGHAM